jgi:uncharacterized glyoxalase superfamily protein PhnB
MKSTPPGWPRISSSVYYDDPRAAIDWLCKAFGFQVALKVEGEAGDIVHSELTYGEGLIMVGGTKRNDPGKEAWQQVHTSPRSLSGANTQSLCIYVDDADAHCEHARASGAVIGCEPRTSDYGEDYWSDRSYLAIDPEGHQWWFMQRLRTGKSRS